jgi:hypothetical protein
MSVEKQSVKHPFPLIFRVRYKKRKVTFVNNQIELSES